MNRMLKVFLCMFLILGTLFALKISKVNAQSQVVCPAGYVCTPIPPQPAGCPVGYMCVKSEQSITVDNIRVVGNTIDNGTLPPDSAFITFSFTLNNLSKYDIYVSKNGNKIISTKVVGSAIDTGGVISEISDAGGVVDTAESHIIPAGKSRRFSVVRKLTLTEGTSGVQSIKVSSINFGRTPTSTASKIIDYGLEGLGFTVTLTNNTKTLPKIVTRVSPAAPLSRIIVPVKDSYPLLAVFDVKSAGVSSTLTKLDFDILVSGGKTASDIFSKIDVDWETVSNIKTNMSVNINRSLPENQFVPINIWGRLKSGIPDGTKVYIRLTANDNKIIAKDSSNKQVPIEATTTVSSLITFISSSTPRVLNGSAFAHTLDNGTKAPNMAIVNFEFTLNNLSSKDLYVDKDSGKSSSLLVTPGSDFSINSAMVSPSPFTLSGDTSNSIIIPANTSRTFVMSYSIKSNSNKALNLYASLKAIKLSDKPGGAITTTVTYGMERLATPLIKLGMENQDEVYASNDRTDSVTITSAIFNSLKFLFGFSR